MLEKDQGGSSGPSNNVADGQLQLQGMTPPSSSVPTVSDSLDGKNVEADLDSLLVHITHFLDFIKAVQTINEICISFSSWQWIKASHANAAQLSFRFIKGMSSSNVPTGPDQILATYIQMIQLKEQMPKSIWSRSGGTYKSYISAFGTHQEEKNPSHPNAAQSSLNFLELRACGLLQGIGTTCFTTASILMVSNILERFETILTNQRGMLPSFEGNE